MKLSDKYFASPLNPGLCTGRLILIASFFLLLFQQAQAQQVIRLYDGKAPGAENWTWSEVESARNAFNTNIVYNVSEPTITVYRPKVSIANGTAIVIAPGGAFHTLSIDNEGVAAAKWLNAKGITVFILKYRLVKSETADPAEEMMSLLGGGDYAKLDSINAPIVPMAVADGLTAVKYIRDHAGTLHVNSQKIGFMGFSAGATVAMSVVYSAAAESRPNFIASIYVYQKAIIGTEVPKAQVPIFIVAASNDNLGFAKHSVEIYLKWLDAKQPAELHMYEKGGHGFGMKKSNITTDNWIEQFGDWLKMNNLL